MILKVRGRNLIVGGVICNPLRRFSFPEFFDCSVFKALDRFVYCIPYLKNATFPEEFYNFLITETGMKHLPTIADDDERYSDNPLILLYRIIKKSCHQDYPVDYFLKRVENGTNHIYVSDEPRPN